VTGQPSGHGARRDIQIFSGILGTDIVGVGIVFHGTLGLGFSAGQTSTSYLSQYRDEFATIMAFVYLHMRDGMKTTKRATLSIMADFGMSPYAWLREPNRTRGIGYNIADSVSGLPNTYGVSKALQSELGKWAVTFEDNCDEPAFDWEGWNAQGLALTKRLKAEVGKSYHVQYHVPIEDPRYKDNWPVIWIDDSGKEHDIAQQRLAKRSAILKQKG